MAGGPGWGRRAPCGLLLHALLAGEEDVDVAAWQRCNALWFREVIKLRPTCRNLLEVVDMAMRSLARTALPWAHNELALHSACSTLAQTSKIYGARAANAHSCAEH